MTPYATAAGMAGLHALCFTTPRPWSEADFAGFLADPAAVFITAEHGFALARVVLDEAELLTIAVAPAARGRGTATALMNRLETALRARGATIWHLEVAEDNAPARALYARAGFAASGRRRGYYRAPDGRRIDALALAKPLVPAVPRA